MRAVDTNILIRFLTRDDPSQDMIARSVLLNGDIWIAKTVLLETEWVLRSAFRYTPQAVVDAFAELLGLSGITVEDSNAVGYAMELFKAGIDFADALHLASRPPGARFVTFDDSFVRRAKKAGATEMANPVS